jgi:hypothetical protein
LGSVDFAVATIEAALSLSMPWSMTCSNLAAASVKFFAPNAAAASL